MTLNKNFKAGNLYIYKIFGLQRIGRWGSRINRELRENLRKAINGRHSERKIGLYRDFYLPDCLPELNLDEQLNLKLAIKLFLMAKGMRLAGKTLILLGLQQ
jgi:hypothetical protein